MLPAKEPNDLHRIVWGVSDSVDGVTKELVR
jgi:hypothetical protein